MECERLQSKVAEHIPHSRRSGKRKAPAGIFSAGMMLPRGHQPNHLRSSLPGVTPGGLVRFPTYPTIMPIPIILSQGVFLIGFLLIAFARPGRRSAVQHHASERVAVVPDPRVRIPLDWLPDSSSLAGVPLRILLSDRSGPGALLRDTLTIRPSTGDP